MPLLRGSVVRMASVQGLASQAGVGAYSTAKQGLVGLVRAMARDAARIEKVDGGLMARLGGSPKKA